VDFSSCADLEAEWSTDAGYAASVKRLRIGGLEVAAGVEPREEDGSAAEPKGVRAELASTEPVRAESRSSSAGWWWEKRKRPVLAEAFVFVFAVGLLTYAAVDPHDFFNSARGVGGFIAALLIVVVIGRRALLRVSRR